MPRSSGQCSPSGARGAPPQPTSPSSKKLCGLLLRPIASPTLHPPDQSGRTSSVLPSSSPVLTSTSSLRETIAKYDRALFARLYSDREVERRAKAHQRVSPQLLPRQDFSGMAIGQAGAVIYFK